MTVSELIEKLSHLNQAAPVLVVHSAVAAGRTARFYRDAEGIRIEKVAGRCHGVYPQFIRLTDRNKVDGVVLE